MYITENIDKTFYMFLKDYAEECGDKINLFDDTRRFTVREILAETEGYARTFTAFGISEGDFVALQTKRTIDVILYVYALMTIGAVAVLCDPHVGVKDYLASSGVDMPVKAIVTRENGTEWEFVRDGRSFSIVPDMSDKPFGMCSDPHIPALVMFTSGSTSASKAVVSSQYAIINNGIQSARVGWYDDDDIAMVITPLNHSLAMFMAWCSVICRYPLFVAHHSSPEYLFASIEKYGITYLQGVPTSYINAAASPERKKYDIHTMRAGMIGGGACSGELFIRLEKELGVTLIPSYGLSECWGITTTSRYDSLELRASGVGKVMPTCAVEIRDGARVLPTDQVGEIYVRSESLMLGYCCDPQATAEAIDEDGWFHTGDLGYLDANGVLHISGRKKDIIIRGGANISAGKIEAALIALPFVRLAAVVGIKDDVYGEVPCAMVVPAGADVTADKIKEALKPVLSKEELPPRISIVNELPLLNSGKPDKRAIKKLFEND